MHGGGGNSDNVLAGFIGSLREARAIARQSGRSPRALAHVDVALMIADAQIRRIRDERVAGLWGGDPDLDRLVGEAAAAITSVRGRLIELPDLTALDDLLLGLQRTLTLLLLKAPPI